MNIVLYFLDSDECLVLLLLLVEHGLQVLADGLHLGIVALFVLFYLCLCLLPEVVLDHLILHCNLLHYIFVLTFTALFLLHVKCLHLPFQIFPLLLSMALDFPLVFVLDGLFFPPQELVNRAIQLSDLSLIIRFDLFDLIEMVQ